MTLPLPFSLAGRTALITGASSGLGAHFARLYAQAGAKVVLAARRTDRIAALAQDIGPAAHAVAMDVTSEDSITSAFAAGEAALGPINIVVANAGTSAPGRATHVSEAGLRMVTDTNFTGAYLTAREGARRMMAAGVKDTGQGRIILIGSITALLTGEGDSAYAATKAAETCGCTRDNAHAAARSLQHAQPINGQLQPHQPLETGQQHDVIDGLGHEIVSPSVEASQQIVSTVECRHQDDGDMSGIGILFQPSANLIAAQAWHHDIK